MLLHLGLAKTGNTACGLLPNILACSRRLLTNALRALGHSPLPVPRSDKADRECARLMST